MADRWLVIGLGNPGPEYEKTRHNIGQLVLDQLSGGQKFTSHKSRMEICEVKSGDQTLVLAKSRGYMNETGGPAKALLDFYKIEPTKLSQSMMNLICHLTLFELNKVAGITDTMDLNH